MFVRSLPAWVAFALLACSGAETDPLDDELTSGRATERSLEITGTYYVGAGANVEESSRQPFQSVWAGMLRYGISTRTAVAQWRDKATFKTVPIKVRNPDTGEVMKEGLEVHYTYRDVGVVSTKVVQSALPLLSVASYSNLSYDWASKTRAEEICTVDGEAPNGLAYHFDPRLAACKSMYSAQQKKADADGLALRRKGADGIPASAFYRTLLTASIKLGADKGPAPVRYPEYDKLYTGGIKAGELRVSLLYSPTDHDVEKDVLDENLIEWAHAMREIASARPGLVLTESTPALSNADFVLKPSGRRVKSSDALTLFAWVLGENLPAGLSALEQANLALQASQRLSASKLEFSKPLMAKIGAAAPKPLLLRVRTQFAENTDALMKEAYKSADMVFYSGHSAGGEGPLEAGKYTKSDFPSSYQVYGFDSCISYNYYGAPYFGFRASGSRSLDMVTNVLAAPVESGGLALGRVIGKFLDGKLANYMEILKAGAVLDPGRVVDGELDNSYTPQRTPIVLSEP